MRPSDRNITSVQVRICFCLLSRDKGKECNGGKKEHTCDTGGKKLIAKKFGAGLVAYKKKAEESPVV